MKMTRWMLQVAVPVAAAMLASAGAAAQGWQVSPARHEITVAPGQSQTFAIRVEREMAEAKEAVRFTATPRDWDLTRSGETIEGNAGSMPESASPWMTFTPAVFPLKAGEHAWVRVTISVPKETAGGVYRTGLFFEEHSIVPLADSTTRRMVLRYRLSTLLYVIVPGVEKGIAVRDLQVSGSASAGLKFTAVLENSGTMHLRPQHWIEVTDAEGAVLARFEPAPTMVVLPKHELEVMLHVPKEKLKPSASYTVKYFVDADRELPIKATTVSLVTQP